MNNTNTPDPILVVDENPPTEVLQRATEHSLAIEATFESAIDRVDSEDISAIITSYQLPDGNGVELIRSVRAEYPNLPIILWTDNGNETIASDAISAGVSDYIQRSSEPSGDELNHVIGRINSLLTSSDLRVDYPKSPSGIPVGPDGENLVFEQLLEMSPVGILVGNPAEEITHVNKRAEEILGISGDEVISTVIGDPEWSIINHSGQPLTIDDLPAKRAKETGEPTLREEIGIRDPDGEVTWLLVNAAPVSYPTDGESVTQVVTTIQDITEQRHRENQLKSREKKFRAVFEESFDAMMIVDDNAEYIDVNTAACDLIGVERADLLGRSIDEFAADDYDFSTAWQDFQDSELERGIFPLVRPDGVRRLVEFAATPDILPGMHLTVLRDVTEQRRTEEELSEIYNRITHAVHGLDTEWRFTHLNDRAEELLGKSESELRGEYVWDHFPDATQRSYKDRYERAMEEQKPVIFEEYSDAAGAWLKVHAYPSETGLSIYFQDITEQKAREQSLRQYKAIVQAVDDGIYAVDETGQFVMVNDAFCELTGFDRGELLGKQATMVHDEDMTSQAKRYVESVHDGERHSASIELDIHTKSGSRIPVEGRIKPFPLSDGVGRCGVVRDISVRKHREEELELFRDLVDHSSDGINVIDTETAEIVEANDASCRMLGYTRSELLSLTVPEFNPEFSMDMWADFVAEVEEEGEKVIESTHQRKDGSTFPVEIKITHVSLDTDYHVAAVRDISERKERQRELESSEERYRALIETAPDPIFVADVEKRKIVETNSAACDMLERSREEIIGLPVTEIHPSEEDQRYKMLFNDNLGEEGTVSEFGDGSPIYLERDSGEHIPVAISYRTVRIGNREFVHGIFRDISDQLRYENALEELNRGARDFLEAETDHEIANRTVDVAMNLLKVSGAAMYFYDDDSGALRPASFSKTLGESYGELPTFTPGNSIAWRAYATQEKAIFDDVRSDEDVYNPGTQVRSEFVLPLGEHGVFIISDTTIGSLDEMSIEIAEILAATAEEALERIEWAQELKEREMESNLHARQLERVNEINEQVRSIVGSIVGAETRQEILQAVCRGLTNIDRFAMAWVGEYEHESEEVTAEFWTGSGHEYLDTQTLQSGQGENEPSVRTVKNRETTVVQNIAADVQQESWRKDALLYQHRSAISIPLTHDEILYGVLTIYGNQPSIFDEISISVLEEVGELIGYALNAVEHQHALLEANSVELTCDLSDTGDTFVRLAERLSGKLEIRNVSKRSDGTYLLQLLVYEDVEEQFIELANNFVVIEDVRQISNSTPGQYEVILSGSCIVTAIADLSVTVQGIKFSEEGSTATISMSQDRDVRTFIEHFREKYPQVSVVSRKESNRKDSPLRLSSIMGELTSRQQEILKTAYYGGFFNSPRKSTGTEIANALGISQPAFSKQLRKSEKTVLKQLYDPE